VSRRVVPTKADLTVTDAQRLAISQGGFVKDIQRMCVAEGRLVREVWPAADESGEPDPQITFDTAALLSEGVSTIPLAAGAVMLFQADGRYGYSVFPPFAGAAFGEAFNPAPTATGQYVCKIDNIDLTNIGNGAFDDWTAPPGTWFQMDFTTPDPPQFTLILDQGTPQESVVTATIHIAPDLGGGSPDLVREVIKPVTWRCELVSDDTPDPDPEVPGNIILATSPVLVEEIKVNEQADTQFSANRNGTFTANGDTSGNYSEDWSAQPTGTETVEINVVSGPTPVGPAANTPHTLDRDRSWVLSTAGEDEDLTSEVDVTIDNGVGSSATKRVTMHSATSTTVTNEIILDTLNATVVDIGFETFAQCVIRLQTEGFLELQGVSAGGPPQEFPWHIQSPTAPNADEYEFRFDLDPGSDLPDAGSVATNTWVFGISDLEWRWTIEAGANAIKNATGTFYVRVGGQPGTEVAKALTVQLNTEGFGGGQPEPEPEDPPNPEPEPPPPGPEPPGPDPDIPVDPK
jgi:hypothetical protein